jgi:hypothetical protein
MLLVTSKRQASAVPKILSVPTCTIGEPLNKATNAPKPEWQPSKTLLQVDPYPNTIFRRVKRAFSLNWDFRGRILGDRLDDKNESVYCLMTSMACKFALSAFQSSSFYCSELSASLSLLSDLLFCRHPCVQFGAEIRLLAL